MYGTIEQLDDARWRLRFTRTLPHSPEKVWRAVTEPEHLAHWFPTTIEGERAAGAPLRFSFKDNLLEPFEGEMLAYEPPRVLEFTWGPDVLRIELEPSDEGTVLTLLDTLEQRGKGARDAAGWHACLQELAAELDGKPADLQSSTVWKEVHPHYEEAFGPEAATIGPPEGYEERAGGA